MGLVGFLRFSLLCLNFLAWPTFALGYPIWASIRAIEKGSKYHMKKLVIYWTIFSLISLLEHTLKLIQWVPLWPYIKLIIICWLVIPRFNGASHAYQGLIHPCLSLNLQTIINWFCWPKDEATFLTSVETYLQENGSEALEKLITSKGQHKEHHVADAQKDMERVELTDKNVEAEEQQLSSLKNADVWEYIQRVEPTDKNMVAEGQSVKHPLENLANTDNKTTTAAQVPKLSMPTVIEEKTTLEISAVKKVQREWTCAVCQVTTTSEATLNSHLKGKRHGKLTAKNLESSTSRAIDSIYEHKKPKNCLPGEKLEQNPTEKPENVHYSAATVEDKQKKPYNAGNLIQHSNLWCSICNIRCCGEIDMAVHLNGRKHLYKVQSLLNSVSGEQS